MATDNHTSVAAGPDSTPRRAAAVTPNDSVDLTFVAQYLFVGTGGDVRVTTQAGDTVTFKAQSGTYLQGYFARVLSTGTTASNIIAQWN